MQIIFLGQKGIPSINSQDHTEARVEALSAHLAKQGHTVCVSAHSSYTPKNIHQYKGVSIIRPFTLDPTKPGGWIHAVRCLFTIWKQQPDIVHIHDWKHAALIRIACIMSPETTYIWTIPSLPRNTFTTRFLIRQAQKAFDQIVSPTREIQYTLLMSMKCKSIYIPDGYHIPSISDIPAKHFGLRKNQYCITTASTIHDIRWIIRAYKKSATQKKLAVFVSDTLTNKTLLKLKKRYPFLRPIKHATNRVYTSLLRQSSLVIASGFEHPQNLLAAMDAKRPIISTNTPQNTEVLGTSAHFIREEDTKELSRLLSSTQKHDYLHSQIRARRHFSWERIGKEYAKFYRSSCMRSVPMDSIVANPSFKIAG